MKHKTFINRLFALVATLALVLGVMPLSSFAADTSDPPLGLSDEPASSLNESTPFAAAASTETFGALAVTAGAAVTQIEWGTNSLTLSENAGWQYDAPNYAIMAAFVDPHYEIGVEDYSKGLKITFAATPDSVNQDSEAVDESKLSGAVLTLDSSDFTDGQDSTVVATFGDASIELLIHDTSFIRYYVEGVTDGDAFDIEFGGEALEVKNDGQIVMCEKDVTFEINSVTPDDGRTYELYYANSNLTKDALLETEPITAENFSDITFSDHEYHVVLLKFAEDTGSTEAPVTLTAKTTTSEKPLSLTWRELDNGEKFYDLMIDKAALDNETVTLTADPSANVTFERTSGDGITSVADGVVTINSSHTDPGLLGVIEVKVSGAKVGEIHVMFTTFVDVTVGTNGSAILTLEDEGASNPQKTGHAFAAEESGSYGFDLGDTVVIAVKPDENYEIASVTNASVAMTPVNGYNKVLRPYDSKFDNMAFDADDLVQSASLAGYTFYTITAAGGTNEVDITFKEIAMHVAVTEITGVPTTATVGTGLALSGTVAPTTATNKAIVWSVKSAGTTGATISGSTLSTTAAGTVVVTATIMNGLTASSDYTQDFTITVSEAAPAFVAVTGITGVPTTATVGTDLTLSGMVAPTTATNKTIVWSVKSAGTTSATISGSTLSTTAAGTVVVTATINNGLTAGSDYTQDFTITVNAAVVNPPVNKYTVTFNSNGGSAVAPITNIESGNKITKPADPTKAGNTFSGWYKETALTTAWNFATDTVTGNITLYAKWTPTTQQPVTEYTVTFNSNGGSAVVSQTIAAGGKVTRPANPTRANYSFVNWYKESTLTTVWNFDSDVVTSNVTLYAAWNYAGGTIVGGGSSNDDDDNSSGGGGGSRGADGATGSGSTSSSAPSTVTSAAATSAVNGAIAAAQASGAGTATAKLTNPGDVSLSTLQAMAQRAGDTPLKVNADSMNGNAVDVRITLDPAKATTALDLSASTVNAAARNVDAIFDKFFSNDVMTVALGQQGSFGMPVEIAARLDPTLATDNLAFYTYDRATNSYTRIAAPAYWVDGNGYVHFNTTVGGNVIISDGSLVKN